jgi:hypothetical protein
MASPYRHGINLIRGDKLEFNWQGEVDGENHDWTSVSVSCRIIDTSDDSQVAIVTPTLATSGDNDEVVTATFSVADTSAYPTGKLRGDVEVSGTALGVFTPVVFLFYVTADTTT